VSATHLESGRPLLLNASERFPTANTWKGRLPSGSSRCTTDDAGIVTLPDDAGQMAFAILMKSSGSEMPALERTIGEINRAVYDFFLFQPKAAS
jgi:hypothetical protein